MCDGGGWIQVMALLDEARALCLHCAPVRCVRERWSSASTMNRWIGIGIMCSGDCDGGTATELAWIKSRICVDFGRGESVEMQRRLPAVGESLEFVVYEVGVEKW